MRIIVVAIATLVMGQAAVAEPARADATCQSALEALNGDWQKADFPAAASKPGQALMVASGGHEASAGQISYMQTQLRLAARDCGAGRNEQALQRMTKVRQLLDSTVHHAL
jgi:hypothetical protein